MTQPVLRAQDLHKRYGQVTAVAGVSLELHAGEVLGLLGPNGAGKSTTIAMLAGQRAPDRGAITLFGQPFGPHTPQRKALLGLAPQEIALYPDLTGEENLRFFGRIYGLRGATLRRRVAEALAWVGLTAHAKRLVQTYSGGMQRRLNLAAGLLHRPQALFLDEPTVGVDPQSRNAIYERVRELAQQGVAVLYTTHYMEEAQRLCHRVAIMDAGRIVAQGTPRDLIARFGGGLLRLRAPADQLPTLQDLAATLPTVHQVTRQNGHLLLETRQPQQALLHLLNLAQRHQIHLTGLEILEANLETVFLALTGKRLRDA